MAGFEIKEGDTLPAIRATLWNGDGTTPDLAGATVTFRMTKMNTGENVVDAAATVIDAPSGIVEYAWAAGDTDAPGKYRGEFNVNGYRTYPGGDNYIDIIIGDNLL